MKIVIEKYGQKLGVRHISDQETFIECPVCNFINNISEGGMCKGDELITRNYRKKCMVTFRKETS
ncbi:hypothetical protein [uncultured Roseivirga sp.]|uniref:hypothetical protein n=1 Tax=uncultured Roseivirga sp. TaxID=543088 RepID=UPI0030D79C59